MNYNGLRYFRVVLCIAILGVAGLAQDETLRAAAGERYVISAKAGGVNYLEGQVSVARKSGKGGSLIKGDALEIGELVTTGSNSKAEILLNPGSYLRLGDNTKFQFLTTSLDELQLKIEGGSAIFEVFAAEDFKVLIVTPRSKYELVYSGIYRLDILPDGEERLEVWKGQARAGSSTAIIKNGRVASLVQGSSVSSAVTKFDRDEKDALDVWSKARSKELAKMTAKLDRDLVRTALMRTFLGGRWNLYSSFGLWVFNPFLGAYCFLPFGYGWGSPYGFGYGHYLGWYDLPAVIWHPTNHYPGGNTGGPVNNPTSTPIVAAGDRSPVPPFVRMQESMGGGRGDFGGDRGGSTFDPGYNNSTTTTNSPPTYSPPVSAPVSAPAPTKVDISPPLTKQP